MALNLELPPSQVIIDHIFMINSYCADLTLLFFTVLLVISDRPKNVTVQPQPGLIVHEKTSLTLHCSAQSYPAATSFIWMKTTDGKSEIIQKTQTIKMNSVSPSDSGLYKCSVSNEIGTGNSQQAEVKVKRE